MPPRGQSRAGNRRVLTFEHEDDATIPTGVDTSKSPAEEAKEWMAEPVSWPSYVPSYEVWCAMTCSSGNYKDDMTKGSPYHTLRQLLLTHGTKAQITNGPNGTLEGYLEEGKPSKASQQPNTPQQIKEQKEGKTRTKEGEVLPKYSLKGFWPKGPRVFPEGVIGLDTAVKMRKKNKDKAGYWRVPHTYNIENQKPSRKNVLYHLEAVSSIMPYTKRQWTLNMGIERMGMAATNVEQVFETTNTGFGGYDSTYAKGTKLTNIEFLRGPSILGQIAILYGLYEYPGCEEKAINWSVTQKESGTGDTHVVRMRVPNPAYWLIASKEHAHYRCIEAADEENLARTDFADSTAALLENLSEMFPWIAPLEEVDGLKEALPKYNDPIHWWGYNSLGDINTSPLMKYLHFFPGMRVPSVDTLASSNVPLLPETQILHRFDTKGADENRSVISPFFFVGVRDAKATENEFVHTTSPWGMYGYIAYKMRRNAELMSGCKCVAPFPTTQPQMLTGFRIPRARWLYPHFNLVDDTFTVKASQTLQTPTFIAEAAVGRSMHTFLYLLSEPMKKVVLSTVRLYCFK